MSAIEFVPHSDKQEDLIFSDAEETIGITGTQWGKSQSGSLWMKRQTHTFTERTDNFLIAAPTYKILQQSIIPYFLYYMHGFGDFSKAEMAFKVKRGGTVLFRTETDPDSIVGIPNLKAGWLDEAGKLRRYFYDNYRARAAAKGAKTLLTSSPYSLNWLWTDRVKPKKEGKLPDLKLIQAASWENPYHTLYDPVKRAKERAQMDPRRFNMIYGGEFGRMEGLVYDCWEDAENLVEPFELPAGTKYYGGIDWGYYPDPFALKIRAITPDGRHYGISEFVKNRLEIDEIALVCQQQMKIHGIQAFYCDPSQPASIAYLCKQDVPALPARLEGIKESVRFGIDVHYNLIKTRRYKEFMGRCPYSADERESYHYPEPEDLGPDDDSKELNPVDSQNHCMDADRYLSMMTYQRGEKLVPKVPEGRRAKTRLDELKYNYRRNHGSESWS